jgi:hypothetical protein
LFDQLLHQNECPDRASEGHDSRNCRDHLTFHPVTSMSELHVVQRRIIPTLSFASVSVIAQMVETCPHENTKMISNTKWS